MTGLVALLCSVKLFIILELLLGSISIYPSVDFNELYCLRVLVTVKIFKSACCHLYLLLIIVSDSLIFPDNDNANLLVGWPEHSALLRLFTSD